MRFPVKGINPNCSKKEKKKDKKLYLMSIISSVAETPQRLLNNMPPKMLGNSVLCP